MPIYWQDLSALHKMPGNDSNSESGVMNKKMITFAAGAVSIAIIGYLVYNSFNQLKYIEYDLFDIEEDIDLE